MENKRIRLWAIAAAICGILALVLIALVFFISGGTALIFPLLTVALPLGIIGVVLAIAIVLTRKHNVGGKALAWALAAFICCVLSFVLSFPPLLMVLGFKGFHIFSLVFPVLLITSIALAIIAIRKRESRHEGLAIGAFFCSSFPLVHIIYFSYFFVSGEPDFFIVMVLLCFWFIALPLGIIAVVLAIFSIRGHQFRGKTLAIVALVIGILEIWPGLGAYHPAWKEKAKKAACGPFVYSFDGKEFVFDSEPYAGAILIERTGYSELNRLAAADRQYQLKIVNELNETQYTDELKLLVVEHPVGTDIMPDVTGHIHTIASPITPTSASELPGTDILHLVSEKDNRFWEGCLSDKSFNIGIGERKELILEFPKPQNAKRAKLAMNVSNTLWSSSASAKFLQSFGNSYPVMSAVRSWARKGFIRFEVQAWENGKWTAKGWIRGASPHLPKDQVLVLDVSAIAGQSLKLRLMLAASFWRIDSAIVDYSEDTPIRVTELEASEAVNHEGQDIREALRADDDNFYVTEKGDSAMITFDEPPAVGNMARSFILKATGCYKIHPSN